MNGLFSAGDSLSVDLDLVDTGGKLMPRMTLWMESIISNGSKVMLRNRKKRRTKLSETVSLIVSNPLDKMTFLPIQFLKREVIKETDTIILVGFPAMLHLSDAPHTIDSPSLMIGNPSGRHSQFERRNMKLLDVVDHSQTEGIVVSHAYGGVVRVHR
jgi:hypothetical protein